MLTRCSIQSSIDLTTYGIETSEAMLYVFYRLAFTIQGENWRLMRTFGFG
jgi:hypothetical protein